MSDNKIADLSAKMRSVYKNLSVPANAIDMAVAMSTDDTGMGFLHWIKYCGESEGFSPQDVLTLNTAGILSPAEQAAYGAPFPDEASLAGARQFPSLVPIIPDNPAVKANRAAWEVFSTWDKPFSTAFSDSDSITAGADKRFQNIIPGSKDQSHITIKGARHFLQEQAPEELAQVTIDLILRK